MEDALLVIPLRQNIAEETPFPTLHQAGYVRAKTDKQEWYLLVTEAYNASHLPFDETVRDYLATMMWRFGNRRELFEQLEAFHYYQYVIGSVPIDSALAQDIADISLQYVAYFPELSRNRHEPRSLEYVANVGETLYRGLARASHGKDDWFSKAYQSMASSFFRAVMVLRSTVHRFRLSRWFEYEKQRNDAMRSLSPSTPMKLGPALEQFRHMYFRKEADLMVPKTIN